MRRLGVALYVGGVTAFLVWALNTYAAGAPALFYFLWVLSAVAFVGLLVSALSPRRSIIDIFYYFYMAYFLLPPAVMQIGADRFPWEVKHSLQHAEYGTILIALTMVAYEVGRALHRPRHPAVVGLATPVLPHPPLGIFILVGAVAALAAIPTLGFNNLFMGRGVLSDFSREISITSYIFLTGKGIVMAAMAWGIALTLALDRRHDPLVTRTYIVAATVLATLVAFVLFSPLSNARFVSGAFFLCLFFLLFRDNFQRQKIWFVLAFPFLIFYVFAKLKDLSFPERRARFFQDFFKIREDYMFSVDFDTMQVVASTVRYVREFGLLGPIEVFGGTLFFIPRSIWLEKPRSSGIVVFENLDFNYTNVSMPLYMEFYLAGGIVGIVLGFILFGWLVARLEGRMIEGNAATSRRRVLADPLIAVVGGFTLIVMRGPIGGIAPNVGVPLGATLIGLLLALRMTAERPVPTRPTTPAAAAPKPAGRAITAWQEQFRAATRKPDPVRVGRARVHGR